MVSRALVPALRTIDDAHDEQHHRHFDEHADDGRERGARVEAEQADRGGHGQLEEIDAPINADGHAMLCFSPTRRLAIGERCVEEHLDQDRHREQRDHQRLLQDRLALEREQQHQRGQQRGDGPRADLRHRAVERRRPFASSSLRHTCARITGMTI